eukprot:CAMPEP_0115155664 /NCGR_PEP_ID=MMETSP0227-20121206/68021_1 /TAXON_ID=89957 /ORGANISM="Polarella glacialis, Strain CCMP 1383" /LENGTH=131 /DNA_ID=CAMNT_0002566767 /DNA_START=283 /DNA_END=678 /DNA_ORIENTATION=+
MKERNMTTKMGVGWAVATRRYQVVSPCHPLGPLLCTWLIRFACTVPAHEAHAAPFVRTLQRRDCLRVEAGFDATHGLTMLSLWTDLQRQLTGPAMDLGLTLHCSLHHTELDELFGLVALPESEHVGLHRDR